jgi:hypothetical protein
MDVARAIEVLTSAYEVRGDSGMDVVRSIELAANYVPPAKALLPVWALHGSQQVRPIEALHQLTRVTGPRYSSDIYDYYMQWGLLRYLGLFDADWHSSGGRRLRLSDAGGRIAGNQRRVTSEEIGIGFGAVLAQRWFESDYGRGSVVATIDIDSALRDTFIYAGGYFQPVRLHAAQRPDYIIVGLRPGTSGRCAVRVLECKGTRSPSYAIRQLTGAVKQLEGVTISGRIPRGLAVSTVSANTEVSYVAVDPEGDEDEFEEITPGAFEGVRSTVVSDEDPDIPAALALQSTWAVLADFGRNVQGLERWAPLAMRRRVQRPAQPRAMLETPFGIGRGLRARFDLDGQVLTVWRLIDSMVDDALSGGDGSAILNAQAVFALRTSEADGALSTSAAFSALPDGSIFAVTLEPTAM